MTEKERIMNTNIIPIKVECEICEVIDSLLAFQHLDEYFEKLKKENIAHNVRARCGIGTIPTESGQTKV